jgi:hypothetical protein
MKGFWEQAILLPLQELYRQAIRTFPGLMAMLIVVVLGLAVGWLLKEITYRALRALRFDRLCDRLGISAVTEGLGLARSSSYLAGQVMQGIIVVAALLGGLNALGSPLALDLVARFFLYLPHLVAALVVLLLGSLISRFLGRSVLIAAVNAHIPSARLLSGLTRFFVMTLATVAALEELGIGRTTIIVTFAILFGGVVAAAAIALGMAARDMARDLLQSQFGSRSDAEMKDASRHL